MPGRIFFIIITALLVFSRSYAYDDFEVQKQKADSLYELVREYIDTKPDSALYFAQLHKRIVYKINDFDSKVWSCYMVGYVFHKTNSFEAAIDNYFEGLEMLENPSEIKYKYLRIRTLQNIGIVYELSHNFDLALEYALKAVQEAYLIGDDKKRAELIYNIGVIYSRKENGRSRKAKQYLNDAIAIGSKIEDNYRLSKTYNMLGNLFFDQSHYDSAKRYFVKAYQTSIGVKELACEQDMFLGNTGECCYKASDFDKAKRYYMRALPISKKFNNVRRIKWLYYNLGNLSNAEGNYQEAIGYYKQCIELGNENVIDKYYKMACRKLSEVYEARENYKEALVYNNKYIAQLNKVEHTKRSLKQENHQFQLTQPKEVKWNTFWISLLAILTLLVIGVVLVHFYHSRKESMLE